MPNVIKPKRTNTAGNTPTTSNLTSGELGVNMADQKTYINNGTAIVQIGAGNVSGLGDVAITSPATSQTLVYNSGTNKWSNATLAAAGGGTGQTSYAVGDLLYASTTSALSKLADVATGNALISGGVGVAPSYGKIGLTTHVSGTLPIANGGTGLTTTPANGALDIGNGTGFTRTTLTAGTGITVTNASGSITIAASGTVSAATPTALGTVYGSMTTSGGTPYLTALGYNAGLNNTGSGNTAVGLSALTTNTTGGFNTAIGYQALNANTVGYDNTAVGYQSLLLNTGQNNIAIGSQALRSNTTNGSNTAVGFFAGYSSTAGASTYIGYRAGYYVTTGTNLGVGYQAIFGNSAGATGANNTAIGDQTLTSITTAGSNTVVGNAAGFSVTTGSNNVLLGYQAGQATTALTTGSNNIIIGYNAYSSSATVSNEVTLGNTSITSTRLYGMVALNMAMFEQATISATAATGTINYDAQTQSVLYYTSNASANWTLNIRASSGTTLNTAMAIGQSMTVAFLVTNGATAYYQSALTVDGAAVTPKWQGGTAPTSGNASAVDVYVITIIKTASATFTALASQTKFA